MDLLLMVCFTLQKKKRTIVKGNLPKNIFGIS